MPNSGGRRLCQCVKLISKARFPGQTDHSQDVRHGWNWVKTVSASENDCLHVMTERVSLSKMWSSETGQSQDIQNDGEDDEDEADDYEDEDQLDSMGSSPFETGRSALKEPPEQMECSHYATLVDVVSAWSVLIESFAALGT
jgi:hypothetical protein